MKTQALESICLENSMSYAKVSKRNIFDIEWRWWWDDGLDSRFSIIFNICLVHVGIIDIVEGILVVHSKCDITIIACHHLLSNSLRHIYQNYTPISYHVFKNIPKASIIIKRKFETYATHHQIIKDELGSIFIVEQVKIQSFFHSP